MVTPSPLKVESRSPLGRKRQTATWPSKPTSEAAGDDDPAFGIDGDGFGGARVEPGDAVAREGRVEHAAGRVTQDAEEVEVAVVGHPGDDNDVAVGVEGHVGGDIELAADRAGDDPW